LQIHEGDHTTHISVVDAQGNAVSLTTTINGLYGSHVVVGGAGFLLNNEMDDFSAKPGVPNLFGVTGGEANAIAPGKRMLSSMTPTIVTRDGKPYMVLGSPGGSTIITAVLHVLLNVHAHDMDMQRAVEAPRFHHQWLPDSIQAEVGAFSREDSLKLVSMGHAFKVRRSVGRVAAIRIRADGRLEGGADPRGDDTAGGY
jgi:gamma-glutamyltranspeptidase/glutathione hydrolase